MTFAISRRVRPVTYRRLCGRWAALRPPSEATFALVTVDLEGQSYNALWNTRTKKGVPALLTGPDKYRLQVSIGTLKLGYADLLRDLRERLGLRNLVRAMDLEFGEVRFFCTAAVADERGRVDPSIGVFVEWCLRG